VDIRRTTPPEGIHGVVLSRSTKQGGMCTLLFVDDQVLFAGSENELQRSLYGLNVDRIRHLLEGYTA
jgi:hypothetical protein